MARRTASQAWRLCSMWRSNLVLWAFDVWPSGIGPWGQYDLLVIITMTCDDVTAAMDALLVQCLYAGWRYFHLVVSLFFFSPTSSPSWGTGRRPEYSTSCPASCPSLEVYVWFTLTFTVVTEKKQTEKNGKPALKLLTSPSSASVFNTAKT